MRAQVTKRWSELGRGALAMLLLATGVAGCDDGETVDDDFECRGGRCDSGEDGSSFTHRWALDMQKIRAQSRYSDNQRFVAAAPTSLLPEPLATQACEREAVVAADGSTQPGGCFLWGNMMRLNPNHSEHVDAPEEHPIINIVDNGQQIDPPGYLNIIAQLNAERQDQTEIRQYLRNGDILVYFHPEDSDTTQFRMHHAAMFYDTGEGPLAINLDGVPFVHHIDNPVSYGPAFNSGPTTPPFHVYRFNPNGAPNVGGRNGDGRFVFDCTDEIRDAGGPPECQAGEATFTISDEMAAQYAYLARNWALITNGHAPFSSFHYMSWNDEGARAAANLGAIDEVDRYALPALERGETPRVYCAGLVYTNLNLALNRPLNQAALGDQLWPLFSGGSFEFDDRFMRLNDSSNAVRGPLVAGELEDEMNLPRLGRLAFEPILASDIIDAWLEGYFGQLPREVRAQVLGGAAERIAGGFRSLEWAAGKIEEAEGTVVATPQRIQQYAAAYGSGDADNYTISVAGGELQLVPGPDGQPDLPQMKDVERQYVDNRYVPPPLYHVLANQPDSLLSYVGTVIHVDLLAPIGDNEGDTGSGGVAEFAEGGPDTSLYEHFYVADGGRHVQRLFDVSSGPARVGHGSSVAARISAADIRDIRLVLHPAGSFDRLDSLYACDRDPDCIGDAPGIFLPLSPEQADGATVWDDVSVSFELFAPETEGGLGCVMVGDVAGTWEDVVFTYGEVEEVLDMVNQASFDELDLQVGLDRRAAENIVAARPIRDMNQLAAVAWVGPAALEDLREYVPIWTGVDEPERYALCPAYDWATGEIDTSSRIRLGAAHGQWTVTMLDLGELSEGATVDNCASCADGGGHSNQWFLVLRDEDGETVDEEPPPPQPCDPDYDEDSSEAAQAAEVTLAAGDAVEGRICDGDEDWIVVEAPAEDAILDVTITFAAAAGDLDLESYDLAGETLDSSTSTQGTETVEGIGTFLVRVHGYNHAQADYSLTVSE